MRARSVATVAFVALAQAPAPAGAQGLVEAVASHQRTYLPTGDGPFPAVVAMPGCSGVSFNGPTTDEGRPGREGDRLFRRHYSRMAERLSRAGYAVVLVDYLTPEGFANTCSGEISHARVAEYVQGALEFAHQQTFVDPERVFVIGWSHGGGGTIAWLESQPAGPGRAAGAIGIYPECNTRGPWRTALPVLFLVGGADDIALPERCESLIGLLGEGTDAALRRFEGGRHGFDWTEGPELLDLGGGLTLGRNDSAGREAWEVILDFLAASGRTF